MPSATLRPNVTLSNDLWIVLGAASADLCLADDTDATYIYQQTSAPTGATVQLGFTTVTLPAGALGKRITMRIRSSCSTTSGVFTNSLILDAATAAVWTGSVGASVVTVQSPDIIDPFGQARINGAALQIQMVGYGSTLYEVYLDVVWALKPVTSAVTVTPSGTVTTSRTPTVSWTYTQGTDGTTQSAFRVKMFSAAQYGAGGFNPDTSLSTYDSKQVSSGATVHVPTLALVNGVTYKAYVQTFQKIGSVYQPSDWASSAAFTLAIPVPVPTAIQPVAGSTVTTSRPALNATVAVMPTGSLTRREWQFASDSGFTANLLTVTEANYGSGNSGPVAFPALPARRAQGVWYIRARAQDLDGVYGSYSAGQSFTIAHAPTTTNRIPSSGISQGYTTSPIFSWTFSDIDTDDFQTKYQVQIWKTSVPGTVIDSGLVTSANKSFQTPVGVDTTWKDIELRWKVAVYDQDNVTGGYSLENTFYLRDLPAIVVTNPSASSVITTAAPLVTWTDTLTAGRSQVQFKVDILRAGTVLVSSGWLNGADLSWQIPNPVVTVGPVHQATVSARDSTGLVGTSTTNFTATYAAITVPDWVIDDSTYAVNGRLRIDWTASTVDASFNSWKVLRRVAGTSAWTLLFETTTPSTRFYDDYTAPSQQAMEYVVVQTGVGIGGVIVESSYNQASVTGTTEKYMLVCPFDTTLNVVLNNVSQENFEIEQEMATINLIGRGRRIEYGTKFGQTGTLTISLRDIEGGFTARQQRLQLEALRDTQQEVLFRDPFGDVFGVALQAIKFNRVPGVGLKEYFEATIDYSEITA